MTRKISVFLFILLFGSLANTAIAQTDGTLPPSETTQTSQVQAEVVKPDVPMVGYDKGFFIQSADEKFKLVIGGYIQGYFEGRFIDDADDTSTFRVRRARLKWSGHVFTKNIQYELEYDFSSSTMLEAVIQLVHSEELKYKVGQYHVPFSLENMTSSSNLQFVDRSITNAFFGIPNEREVGTGINGTLMNKKLEYDVGIFNGDGVNTLNLNEEYRYAGRLLFNIAGQHKNEFSDIGRSEKANLSVAVAGMFNDTLDPTTIVPPATIGSAEMKVYSVTPELNLRHRGIGAHASYFYQHINRDTGATTTDHGFLAQLGYMLTPKMELAARAAFIFPEALNDTSEYTAGFNYYLHKDHRAKLQIDYSALSTENGIAVGDDRLDHRVRAQLQVKL